MVRRKWPPEYLERMTPGEFQFYLEAAVEAAKDEAEATKRASKG